MMKAKKDNLFAGIPANLPNELVQCLVTGKHVRIERIVSQSHATAEGSWYDQEWDEWVILLQGEATIRYENGRMLNLRAGEYVNIPAHCRHRVEWTAPGVQSIWLAIHYDSSD